MSIDPPVDASGDFADLDAALEHAERETSPTGTFVVGKVLACGAAHPRQPDARL